MNKEIMLRELPQNSNTDFKDGLFDESLIQGDLKYKNLKKWIRYSATNCRDADKILKLEDNSGLLKEKLNWELCEHIDCIFSLRTFFNAFLRYYFSGTLPSDEELMDNFDSYFSDSKLQEFQKRCGLSETEMDEFFKELDLFAKQTHTLGNYMPCPDSKYNRIKGYGKGKEYFQDRIELLYTAVIEGKYPDHISSDLSERWKKWFAKQSKILYLDEIIKERSELMKFVCPYKKRGFITVFVMKSKDDIISYTAYLQLVNKLILNRTDWMMAKIKE